MAKDFTDLVAWQLARKLKRRVFELVKRPQISRDFDFVRQIVDAAASGPRNVAEGFGRFRRKEFAHFLKIAISSEHEVRNHVVDAHDRGYITVEEQDDALKQAARAIGAATQLRRYLLSNRNPYD